MEAIKDFLRPEVVWFIIGLLMLLAELMLPGLIIFFFGLGAWVVALVCLFTDISLNAQLLIFILSSVTFLLILRKWLKGVFKGFIKASQDVSEEMKEFIGEKAVVTKAITPAMAGKVEFHGTSWTAEANEEIAEGSVIEIIGKNNITLKVKKIG